MSNCNGLLIFYFPRYIFKTKNIQFRKQRRLPKPLYPLNITYSVIRNKTPSIKLSLKKSFRETKRVTEVIYFLFCHLIITIIPIYWFVYDVFHASGGLMVVGSELEVFGPSSNSILVHCIHFHTITFGKGMNYFFFSYVSVGTLSTG